MISLAQEFLNTRNGIAEALVKDTGVWSLLKLSLLEWILLHNPLKTMVVNENSEAFSTTVFPSI